MFSERGDWFLWDKVKGNLLPSPLFLCPGIRVVGRFIKIQWNPCPNFFFKKGEGLFNAKISIFLMSDRFVGCPGIRVVGRFIKIQGNLCPIFFFKCYLICQNYSILVLMLCPWFRQVCWLSYYIKLSWWWEDLFKYR